MYPDYKKKGIKKQNTPLFARTDLLANSDKQPVKWQINLKGTLFPISWPFRDLQAATLSKRTPLYMGEKLFYTHA